MSAHPDEEYREKIAGDEYAAQRRSDEHELWARSIYRLIDENITKRFVVQTRYGSIELPQDELWYSDETKTVHLSVRIPKGYDLVKQPQ